MRRTFRAAIGALVVVVGLGLSAGARAQLVPDTWTGPPLSARYSNYVRPPEASPDQSAVNSLGGLCTNDPTKMPSNRQSSCITNLIQHPSTGVYRIVVSNGAPLPKTSSTPNDNGWTLFVTPVGSNARCAETATTWNGLSPTPSYQLTSTITCVNPAGANVDTHFSWFYRTDSQNYPQAGFYQPDFVYARVNRPSGVTPSQVVASETFVPHTGTFNAGSVTVDRTAQGKYRVRFANVNEASSTGWLFHGASAMNNVIVQRTCMNDSTSACKRAVCVPAAWAFGNSQTNPDTTVDVHCYLGSAATDVDFRVYLGSQSQTSSWNPQFGGGSYYGWMNSPGFPSVGCKDTNQFIHRNQHETPMYDFPTLPLSVCRTGTGAYSVSFASHGSFYHWDQVTALATSRTAGAYCNVGGILCGGATCVPPPDPYVSVRCYDNTSGNATSALWNMSMSY